MRIESVFRYGEKIPERYTCDGMNISLPIIIFDVPMEAKSLVLIMYDPDIPQFVKDRFQVDEWNHWILFNIDSSASEIPEGSSSFVGMLGMNTNGKTGYTGPCPPDRQHRYFLKLYALNRVLGLNRGATREGIEKAMKGAIISQTELMGVYEKKK
ncbi:YbhB/YbcL family Raf kinase inhibitor-like protein [Candidatus Pacearchaeota archaeon]|nr:YbhB/YbcL family Raf kinase inhibitor-like protein [Candidatus Pacearchaeota archaeon]